MGLSTVEGLDCETEERGYIRQDLEGTSTGLWAHWPRRRGARCRACTDRACSPFSHRKASHRFFLMAAWEEGDMATVPSRCWLGAGQGSRVGATSHSRRRHKAPGWPSPGEEVGRGWVVRTPAACTPAAIQVPLAMWLLQDRPGDCCRTWGFCLRIVEFPLQQDGTAGLVRPPPPTFGPFIVSLDGVVLCRYCWLLVV